MRWGVSCRSMQIYVSRTLTATFLLLIDKLLIWSFTAAVLAWFLASRARIRALLAPLHPHLAYLSLASTSLLGYHLLPYKALSRKQISDVYIIARSNLRCCYHFSILATHFEHRYVLLSPTSVEVGKTCQPRSKEIWRSCAKHRKPV